MSELLHRVINLKTEDFGYEKENQFPSVLLS